MANIVVKHKLTNKNSLLNRNAFPLPGESMSLYASSS